jgi:pyruvate dehydrogenase E1 component
MLPFYIFYSMFGFQRVGDLIWAAGDSRTRGFLLGGTSGRTTLSGEGLQHQDGHSHLMAAAVPNCVAYDPTFAYEIVTILQDGMRRMLTEQEDVFYYVTVMNENYPQPAMPENAHEGILRGLYLLKQTEGAGERVQLLGSGSILREAIAAADLLRDDFGIAADVWSATSFTELARDGIATERWNLLHPVDAQRTAYVTQQLTGRRGPVIAATDYVRAVAEQIRPYVPGSYRVLGTDGFGRSDLRERLRRHFEVDRGFIATAALKALCDEGRVPPSTVRLALEKYGISAEKPQPAKS